MFGKYIRVKLKDLTPIRTISWSQEQLDMKWEIINNYNPRIKTISISSDYKVCDGNHRYTILLDHYGGEYEIIVKKQVYSKRVYKFFSFIIGITILPFFLIYLFIKKLKKEISH